MFFDSHAHYDDERFDADREQVLTGLSAYQVDHVINVGSDMTSSRTSISLSQKYDFIYAAVGVHPHETEQMTEQDLEQLKDWLTQPKVVALGEIGLDYYYDHSPRQTQRYWFDRQLSLAEECKVPVIIHDRDAHGDTLELLQKHGHVRGVLHCYSGSVEMAQQLLNMGFYLGFGGSCTFKNAKTLPQVIQMVPEDRFLIETDCPYLAPVPHRGERNHSGLLPFVAAKIGDLRGWTVEQVAQISAENTKRLFDI